MESAHAINVSGVKFREQLISRDGRLRPTRAFGLYFSIGDKVFVRAVRMPADVPSGAWPQLRPSDQAEFVLLHQAGMRGDDAYAEAVCAAFRRGNASLVNIIAVSVGLAALI
jgi:hypothetical protein